MAGSEGGLVPEKYLIVRNNDLVQAKYILVYPEHSGNSRSRKRFQKHSNDLQR